MPDATVEAYQRNGFVHVPALLSEGEVERFRSAALALTERTETLRYDRNVFTQLVNVWRRDEVLRQLTLHPGIAAHAERLAGADLRLWHDQVLIKDPHNEVATEFHQDQPYWPHGGPVNAITTWVALVDVPVERGC